MSEVVKCEFCNQLFVGRKAIDNACPTCLEIARRNSGQEEKSKKFVESDGFFDNRDYLSEEKRSGFFESSEYNLPNGMKK